jgi:AcrR family transcriptional regulator
MSNGRGNDKLTSPQSEFKHTFVYLGARLKPTVHGDIRRAPVGPAAIEDTEGTRERILTVATRLFAAQGFHSVSLRTLTNEAEVNLASVSYHFGSKEGLVAAIFDRHCAPMMDERRRLLAACAEMPGRPPLLEQIIEAFITPAISITADTTGGGATFSRLRAVLAHENQALAEQLIAKHFDNTSAMFIDALQRCVPRLDRVAVYWRFHFLLGSLYYTSVNPGRIRQLSGGKCDPADTAASIREMVKFVAAGFRAA